jgi:copper chaperone CopZ
MNPTIEINSPLEQARQIVEKALEEHGYRAVRSFDLQEAAAAHGFCPCPHHGTDACTCQYMMLMAYPCPESEAAPFTIAVHGRGQRAWVSLVSGQETEWLGIMLPLMNKNDRTEETKMSEKTVSVPNINCGHCTQTIKMELGEMPGVQRVDADVESRTVTVEWNEPADWEQIKSLLAEINYPVSE